MKRYITLAALCGCLLLAGCERNLVARPWVVQRSTSVAGGGVAHYHHRGPHYKEGREVRRVGYAYSAPRERAGDSGALHLPPWEAGE